MAEILRSAFGLSKSPPAIFAIIVGPICSGNLNERPDMPTMNLPAEFQPYSQWRAEGNLFELSSFEPRSGYILLLFWSAGCSHCMELVDKLYPWQQQTDILQKVQVVAISLDETETEVKAWDQQVRKLPGWKHIRAAEGVRSKVAADYFVLATPVMVLLDVRTREIVALPDTPEALKKALQKK